MAIRPIITAPNPVLRKKTEPIKVIDESIRDLVSDMLDTLAHAAGVGLAAPQIGVSLRICALHLPDWEPFVIINPEIVKRVGKREVEESCLSLPGYQGKITRAVEVTVEGFDLEGQPVQLKARKLLAQAFEHEIDHLDGVLYTDHIKSPNGFYKIEPEEIMQAEEATYAP